MSTESFDAVIVGSGFGGSVMAYRLREAGLSVCLLERGKAYPPGSFPRSPHKMKQNFWDPSSGLYGMFDVWSFRGLGALISSGLGGGSLIYANVLLRKDEKWFVREDPREGTYEDWPVTRADLEPHYDRAEKMLKAQVFPFEHAPYKDVPKTRAMQAAGKRLQQAHQGLKWGLPPLAVTFANAGRPPVPGEPIEGGSDNLHGAARSTCRLCGECDIGCNYGSKNTLDFNYLSLASKLGADVRTRCEVRGFNPCDAGYEVSFVRHDASREGVPFDTRQLPLHRIACRRLILSAGALGTPFLLLKNRGHFPRISPRLGSRFGGNGDLLTLVYKSCENGAGAPVPRVLDPSYGPVITSYLRIPDRVDGGTGPGFYVEDAGYPEFVNWMVQLAEAPTGVGRLLRFVSNWIERRLGLLSDSDISKDIADLFGDCALSKSSLPLLGMGRDTPSGNMTLRDGYLDIDWRLRDSEEYFGRVRALMQDIAGALEAKFLDDPIWYLSRVITVHPLGGAPMGRSAAEGVVDSKGEVFGYPGLHVADGAVMPGPVGPNPSLTIAALADRFADAIVAEERP